jgi:hypothetical protein
MKISTPLRSQRDGVVRYTARLTWETNDRPAIDIHYEVLAEHATALPPRLAESFVIAAVPIAQHAGEARVFIDDEVCPLLVERLRGVQLLQAQWHGIPQPCRIEAPSFGPLMPSRDGAGVFLSGGADSLFTLLHNHDRFPPGHPRRYTHGLLINGFDLDVPNLAGGHTIFDRFLQQLQPVAADMGITLLPVWTNARAIDPSLGLYEKFHFGALLASAAHVFSGAIARFGVSSDNTWQYLGHRGSHPLLMANFTSSALDCDYEGASISRMDKIRRLVQSDALMRILRVCYTVGQIPEGQLNCGRCRKCVITLMEILAAGGLDRALSFDNPRLTPDLVDQSVVNATTLFEYYDDLIEPLETAGHHELANAIRRKIRRGESSVRWKKRWSLTRDLARTMVRRR